MQYNVIEILYSTS